MPSDLDIDAYGEDDADGWLTPDEAEDLALFEGGD